MGQSARSGQVCYELGRYDPPDPGKIGDGDGDDPPDSGKSGMGPPTPSPDKSGIGTGMGIGASAPWCPSLSVLT